MSAVATEERGLDGEGEAALDIGMLLDSVARSFAGPAVEGGAWSRALDLGLPLLCESPDMGRFEDGLRVLIELGRAGSGIPLAESISLNIALPGFAPQGSRVAIAFGETGDIGAGRAEFADGHVSARLRLVDGAREADHILLFDGEGRRAGLVRRDSPGVTVAPVAALVDGLCDLRLEAVALERTHDLAEGVAPLLWTMRLALCARALGAALRGFDAVVDYARIRRQFGQAIGSFQAVQHKLADGRIRLDASRLMLLAAARGQDAAAPHWQMLAASAVGFAGAALRRVALETQHCFGAIGFAEEHEAPGLFRRVHGDTARLGGATRAAAALGAVLVDDGASALESLLAPAHDPAMRFRARFRDWLAENWTLSDRTALAARPFEERDWDLDFAARLGRDGWTTLSWPENAGGMAATAFELLAFIEEMQLADAPGHAMICPCRIIAPEIIAHGSERLKRELLPLIRAGRVTGCLGYSEPEAGSDLASLRTRARRDGDEYRIDGQKIWTTDGQRASHMILAARTDPDARRAGISLFILPMDTPGISVRPMTGLHGHVFCSIFFDDVRIPAAYRLGEEGQGWAILSNALANERITMGAFVSRLAVVLGRIIDAIRDDAVLRADRAIVQRIGELAASLMAGRELAMASLRMMDDGVPPLVEAAAAKIHASELAQAICEAGLDLLGGQALLGADAPDAPADGLVEEILRLSIMYVVGGGSNEIQRTLIAMRGLGLGG
ncbi:acyl-CoA dehydrogenase family protein [Sphingomonas colocasiae]|uniref:Acyl-CoA dehydrogenase family protein n=1 Tax=Sphingomonas colocasiae TaxID=1848973 RepID=A0ABS7PW86_9SPHN|nr:acyl-CoA dehydrogenase family protein [Sphingomonas colocasiae]MBY8825623.1 acyl-CoA dehydrogenase family protein [Sphingomonas colocasiae]